MSDQTQDGVVVQSVFRATQIVELVADYEKGIRITDIAKEMGLSKSTIFGLVNTLTIQGYLRQSEDDKKYHLGYKLFELGALMHRQMDLRTEAADYLAELNDRYHETVHLAVHSNGEVVYIDKIESPDAIITYSSIGKRLPMFCTGVGKAMLAYLSPEYLNKYIFNQPLIKNVENTIIDPNHLRAELELVRKRGYAIDNEEYRDGIVCVAAPIFDNTGSPAASISISSYRHKNAEEIERIAPDVVEAANAISHKIGYRKASK